jgi:hypothetical protein
MLNKPNLLWLRDFPGSNFCLMVWWFATDYLDQEGSSCAHALYTALANSLQPGLSQYIHYSPLKHIQTRRRLLGESNRVHANADFPSLS